MPKPQVNWSQEEILQRVEIVPWSGCWIWMAAMSGNGRGAAYKDGKQWKAYRLAYELFVGPIPDGLYVLHRCDVGSCVNPGHLFLGSAKHNTHDMIAKGRAVFPFRQTPGLASAASRSVSSDGKRRGGLATAAKRWGYTHKEFA